MDAEMLTARTRAIRVADALVEATEIADLGDGRCF